MSLTSDGGEVGRSTTRGETDFLIKKNFSLGGQAWDVTDSAATASSSSSVLEGPNAPDPSTDAAPTLEADQDQDIVNVVVRVRPLNKLELERKDNLTVQFPGDGVLWTDNNGSSKPFAFNVLFEPEATQQDVFEHSGMKKLVSMATEGFACTCFAFGQTGSGKTHTITGPPQQFQSGKLLQDDYGLIPRSFSYLCELINNRRKDGIACSITASYFELYNEQVLDLLNPRSGRRLNVRWSKEKGFHVENVFTVQCENADDLMAVLDEGLQNRSTTAHNMNEFSSRSHSMLALSIESDMSDPNDESLSITKQGKLTFVDLAGSEKVKDTSTTGNQLLETNNINKSLLVLGKCISALGNPKKRNGHIPYRDSKLTKLLADSIGGSGVTLMIACVSPSSYNFGETMNTLRYATRAKRIKNKPVIRMDPREKLIMGLKKEIKWLRSENEYLREQLKFPRKSSPSRDVSKGNKTQLSQTDDSRIYLNGTPTSTGNGTSVPRTQNRVLENTKGTAAVSNARNNSVSVPNGTGATEISAAAVAVATAHSSDESQKDLYDMLKEYMVENEVLRTENADVHQQGDRLQHDQQLLFRENDRLRRKIEDMERFILSTGESRPIPLALGAVPMNGWPWYEPIYHGHSGLSSASSQASRQTYASSLSDFYGPTIAYSVPTSPSPHLPAARRVLLPHPSAASNHQQRQSQHKAYRLVHLPPPPPPQPASADSTDGTNPAANKPPLPSVQGSYITGTNKVGAQSKPKRSTPRDTTPAVRVIYGGPEEQMQQQESAASYVGLNGRTAAAGSSHSQRSYLSDSTNRSVLEPTTGYATNGINERLKKELIELDGEIRSAQNAIQNSG